MEALLGNLGFKGSRGRVVRGVEVVYASLSYRIEPVHESVVERVRTVVDRVDDIVGFDQKHQGACTFTHICRAESR